MRQKPLSQWIHKELGHIENLSWNCAVKVLAVWNELDRFIPGVRTEQHLLFLLKNQEKVNEYPDFESVIKQITEIDTTWNTLCRQLKIEPSFIHENQKGVREFLYQGGAEIISLFLRDSDEDAEKIRRLCMAEIAGRFYDVKYHKGDLEREISLKVPDEIEEIWKKNLSMKEGNAQLWEEDRLLPVMQIGELVGRTCLSYRNGRYKECLLSAFDANKKVLYFALNGQLVFRAFIRLTKGTLSNRKSQNNHLQFVDITKEEQESASKQIDQTEQLTLFLERPYFKGISEEKEREIVQFVLRMLKQKAKKMSAQLILSNDYKALVPETSGLVRAQYHMYISASKNGKQYLDSLGGMATINNEGSYEKLKTLSYEVLENPLKISSFQDHGALHLRLGISKDALKRLRKNDGDMKYLTWLQEENRSPHYLDDELIFWYMENHIEPNELNFIHTKMSYVQIRNYLIRQKGKRKDSISQVLTTWKDYISMAKRVKMNINDEIVYRATKLYKRHNDLIKYIEDNQLSVTAGELADKYPNINSVLSGLREKYEYSDETFTILAPRCIEDILKEGQALHHCIDKKTEYLERINEQETYILFLRNTKQPDTPYYTLEVEPGGVIRQKRTEYDRQNKDIEAASAFLREWQLEIQKRITENDRELANRSRQLRMESYAEMRKKKVKINGGLFQGKYLADVLEADLMEMPDTLQQAA